MQKIYTFDIEAIVILPDHFHMVITPQNAKEYPKIIKAIKYNFTQRYNPENIEQSMSRYQKKMRAIWQKRYYEHTIRDQKDYLRCLDYIYTNPQHHGYVTDSDEWRYSSFFKS